MISPIPTQVRELMLMAGFGALVLMGKPGKDAAPDTKGVQQYIARGLYKYYNEFSYYYDPTEFEKLLGNSMPIVGLAQDKRYFLWNTLEQVYGFTIQDDNIIKL